MESFNMKQEFEEGDFTEAGVYILKKDDLAIHDGWLQGIGKKDIEMARMAHETKQKRDAKREKYLETQELARGGPDQALKQIFALMQPGESVSGTIKRLAAGSSKPPSWKKPKKIKNALPAADLTQEQRDENKKKMETVSSLATEVLEKDPGVYEKRFEDIAMYLKSAKLLDALWTVGQPL
ncbi:hypothetical protein HDU91_003488 [Kappamyces sp. JEL0680]|nr:hypothetical protein HDU91_003488 [Kappamyces sp. JEL0680]